MKPENRKKIISLGMLLATCFVSSGQQRRIDVSVMGGYTFQETVSFPEIYGSGVLHDGFNWTVTGEYYLNPLYAMELKYGRQDTRATVFDNSGFSQVKESSLSMNYIMLGGSRYFRTGNEDLQPYAGFGLGAAIIAPKGSAYGDVTRFAWEAKIGTKYFFSSKVGVRVQAQLLSPVQGVGGGFYFGTDGIGTGISTYSTLYQFSFNGGLVLRLGN